MFGLPRVTELEAGLLALIVAVVGSSLATAIARQLRDRGRPPHAVRGVRVAISAGSILIAVGIFLASFGSISFLSGLTVSAVVGIAITLALQTTLQNLLAGYLLLRNKMLRLGDTIVIGGITGQVVQLGFVSVWLRLPDGNVAFVSNSTLLSGPLVNRSAGDRLKGEY